MKTIETFSTGVEAALETGAIRLKLSHKTRGKR
jgi:hypothetical protein